MTELKTKMNDNNVLEFLNCIEHKTRRKDGLKLYEIMNTVTNVEPKMWGNSIVGYGKYHYKSTRSPQESDFLAVGFSPRKQSLSVYIMSGFDGFEDDLQRLGKHKLGKGCLYINKLADVDLEVLASIIKKSYDNMNGKDLLI